MLLRWFGKRETVSSADAVRRAELERERSQQSLEAARPRIELLRRMRRENHISILLDSLVQKRADNEQ